MTRDLPPNPSTEGMPAAIVLAAGASKRFGTHKLSQPLSIAGIEKPVVVHTLLQWLKVFDRCFLVMRPGDTQLLNAISALSASQRSKVQLIEADQADAGMAFSLRKGVSATADAPGWSIGLADMPWIPTEALQRVACSIQSGASLAAPFYQGERGHPVGFSRQWYAALMTLEGDKGARAILQYSDQLQRIDCDKPGVVRDIDTPADIR